MQTEWGTISWQTYSPELIEHLQASSQAIYIDFTAAWCITCQVNKKVVFGSEQAVRFLIENNVAFVKGDWTNANPIVTQALESFGRQSVPLNVVYPAGAESDPVMLPSVLTPQIVIDAFQP